MLTSETVSHIVPPPRCSAAEMRWGKKFYNLISESILPPPPSLFVHPFGPEINDCTRGIIWFVWTRKVFDFASKFNQENRIYSYGSVCRRIYGNLWGQILLKVCRTCYGIGEFFKQSSAAPKWDKISTIARNGWLFRGPTGSRLMVGRVLEDQSPWFSEQTGLEKTTNSAWDSFRLCPAKLVVNWKTNWTEIRNAENFVLCRTVLMVNAN